MSEYRLHCFAQSGNAYKAALMLELCGADWEPVFVDFFNGATRVPAFRESVNEMGEAPVLEHGATRLTQSGAVLTYLAERLGRFGGRDESERLEILRWILFDNHKFTSYFATYRFFKAFMPHAADPAVLAFLEGRMKSAWFIVEKHLAGGGPYLLGAEPTIADISLAGYVYYPISEHGIDIAATFPAIHAWGQRIAALPGWKHPDVLMPGGPAGW